MGRKGGLKWMRKDMDKKDCMPGSFIQFGQDLNRTEITHRDFNARRMGGGADLIPVLFGINLVNQQIILIYLSLKN